VDGRGSAPEMRPLCLRVESKKGSDFRQRGLPAQKFFGEVFTFGPELAFCTLISDSPTG
jgi:hypothetical protein